MASGQFGDEQLSTTLTQVIATAGVFPSNSSFNDDNIIGLIRTFAGNNAPGGATADGQTVQINQNTALFSIIGTLYGGNGMSTYALPNLNGNIAVGDSPQDLIGTATGAMTAQVSAPQFPPSLGGTSQPVTLAQPSLSIEYLIRVQGVFPSSSNSTTTGFIGEVLPFAGTTVPDGFMVANGATLSIASNPALFSIIGTTYGGNGTSNFKLPDLTGRNIVGASSSVPVGSMVGQSSVTLSQADLPVANGGSGIAFNDQSPGLALTYIISEVGIYPGVDNTGAALSADQYVGEVRAFAGLASEIPGGWVLANGQTIPIQDNTTLFTVLGTQYGGDGVNTFAVPNLNNSVVAGSGSNLDGQVYGSNTASLVVTNGSPCLCAGTRVLTPRGEVLVEQLSIGDEVITLEGDAKPIRWIGRRSYAGRFLRANPDVHPVLLSAGSLGDGLPARDLMVSPKHAMLLDAILVPAGLLTNNDTIRTVMPQRVDYFHLELDRHEVILAEGAPCESFLDDDSRQLFHNASEYTALYPHEVVSIPRRCAPLVMQGAALEAIRTRLNRLSRAA